MNKKQILDFVDRVFTEHGLYKEGWVFKFDRAKSRAGVTKWYRDGRKEITISYEVNSRHGWDFTKDTILHEVAHALSGMGNGHNHVWKRNCRKLGIKPVVTFQGNMPESVYKWQRVCPNCKKKSKKYIRKINVKSACRSCCREFNDGKYTTKFKFIMVQL